MARVFIPKASMAPHLPDVTVALLIDPVPGGDMQGLWSQAALEPGLKLAPRPSVSLLITLRVILRVKQVICEALGRGPHKPKRLQEAALLLSSPVLSAAASGPLLSLLQTASPATGFGMWAQAHRTLVPSLRPAPVLSAKGYTREVPRTSSSSPLICESGSRSPGKHFH